MRPALLFAAIGPNPASVSEAIYALHTQRGLAVVEAHLVTLKRGNHWLERELLGAGAIVGELRDALPGVLPDGDASVFEALTMSAAGTERAAHTAPVDDDTSPAGAAAYRATIWNHAVACLRRAGDRPVVFLLAGGRMRTTTAYSTTVFQLLGRRQDLLLDVRVSDRRAEGGSGFYFPTQRQQQISVDDGVLTAASVEIQLIDVHVPRLAGLLNPDHLASYETALEASRQAIAAMSPPSIVIDFSVGEIRVDGQLVPFTKSQVCWYGLLALKRQLDGDAGDGSVAAAASFALVQELLAPVAAASWNKHLKDYTLRQALKLGVVHSSSLAAEVDEERLAKLRADTSKTISVWLDKHVRPGWAPYLVPIKEKHDGESSQRLGLPPGDIHVVW